MYIFVCFPTDIRVNDGNALFIVKINIWCRRKHWTFWISCYVMTIWRDLQLVMPWSTLTSVSCRNANHKTRFHLTSVKTLKQKKTTTKVPSLSSPFLVFLYIMLTFITHLLIILFSLTVKRFFFFLM